MTPTRRLTGIYKTPDVKESDDELIDAVARLLYQQIVEGSALSRPTSNEPEDTGSK